MYDARCLRVHIYRRSLWLCSWYGMYEYVQRTHIYMVLCTVRSTYIIHPVNSIFHIPIQHIFSSMAFTFFSYSHRLHAVFSLNAVCDVDADAWNGNWIKFSLSMYRNDSRARFHPNRCNCCNCITELGKIAGKMLQQKIKRKHENLLVAVQCQSVCQTHDLLWTIIYNDSTEFVSTEFSFWK